MSIIQETNNSAENQKGKVLSDYQENLSSNTVENSDKSGQVSNGEEDLQKVRSQLPPNFEITIPEVSSITRYSKTLGEAHIVYAQVQINGEDISKENNLKVQIKQKTADHDEFEILCPSEAFKENNEYPFSNTKKYLGGKATVQLIQFGQTTYIFTGIITEITSRRVDGYTHIVLIGKSPTILLENGKDCQSFERKNLEQVIKGVVQEYSSDLLNFDIRPILKQNLLYVVQYRESDYDFIKRMAKRLGEWFYYDGQKIVFGGYGGKTVEMIEEQDIYEYELIMKTVPQKFTYLSYGGKQADNYVVNSSNVSLQEPSNPFQFQALKASERLFDKVPANLYNQSLLESGEFEIQEAVKRQKQSRQNVFYLEAKSGNPNVKLGDIVKLRAWMPEHEIFGKEGVPLESYRVIELTHYHDGVDEYYNRFVAVPHENAAPPYMDEDAIPLCEEQSAMVTDNNDPEGLSRIRVQFTWQKFRNEQSPWIRVITPYAGKGKGMHILPEIGEEVVVAFENGNAEKPVVLGAMFNGKGKSGHGGLGNFVKGFRTRTGSNLTFNDLMGSMDLQDRGGAKMNFDGSGNASLDVKVQNTETVGVSKSVSVGTSNSLSVGVSNIVSVGGAMAVLSMDASGNILVSGTTNITLQVGANAISITPAGITIAAGTGIIDISALATLAMNSAGPMTISTSAALAVTGGATATITSGHTFVM